MDMKSQKVPQLNYVGGLSTLRSQCYAISPLTGELAYICGWVIIFYDMKERIQKHYIVNPKSWPYSSLAFSKDGTTLLAGESMTKHSSVHHFDFSYDEKRYIK